MPAQKITIQGFLSKFVALHTNMPDRPFCWVLGSGASVQSRIPSGGALATQWLREMHEQEDFKNLPLEKWATAENLDIERFDFANAAASYPWIYQRRFRDDPEEGYAFLEKAMADAEPSYGYSVLAQIMAGTRHQVAVTTNFDNLVADALATYTSAFPLVCGHESLTGYIRASLRRPLVAKIHRDLLLNPLNNPGEIHALPKEWSAALTVIFNNFTPIVIGYGGNDGSLMGFLKDLPPIKGGIFWCHRSQDEPDSKVHEVVEHHHGRLVPILGFDELMLQLWGKLSLTSPIPDLEKTHKQRVADWQKQFEELSKRVNEPGKTTAAEEDLKPVREAAAAAAERLTKEEGWWAWVLKDRAETDPIKREIIYREGLADFPESAELNCTFAIFMTTIRKNYDEAERLYRKALELDPKNAFHIGTFALFMKEIRKDSDEAERLYRQALELDPKNVLNTASFADFMKDIRKDYDEAERLYGKALELDPKHALTIWNFGDFMEKARNNYAEAERLYEKAVELSPNNKEWQIYLAVFRLKHKGGKP
jgi:tetratricopeptide (TPR) repeat protein